jgi:tRNA(Leu) C34 or U34 (ribose-2'-O)-methylase TrmL
VLAFPANIRQEPKRYSGNWELQDLAKIAIDLMESFVSIVTSANYESFVNEDPSKNKVLLFTNKKATPPLFKALSKEYKGRLLFGQIK